MSTYDFLASKAKRMRKRLSRVTGDYRQAYADYSSAYSTYTTEFEEAEAAEEFMDKYGGEAVQYKTDKETALKSEYFGETGEGGKLGEALTAYTEKLSSIEESYGLGEDMIPGTADDLKTGKFSLAEQDYLGKVEAIQETAKGKDKTAFETHYGVADDPETTDVDEFKRGKIHDVQDTFRDTTETGKRLGGIHDRYSPYGADVMGMSGDAGSLKQLGSVLRNQLGTIKAADTDMRSPTDPYGKYGEAMWGYDVLSKWLKGEVDPKYKEYQRLGSRAMEALGYSMQDRKAENHRIYKKVTTGDWWNRKTEWKDITGDYAPHYLSHQLNEMYDTTGVKQIEEDIGYLTGVKYGPSGNKLTTDTFEGSKPSRSAIRGGGRGGGRVTGDEDVKDGMHLNPEYTDYLEKIGGVDTSYSDALEGIYGEGGYVETETGKESGIYEKAFTSLQTDMGGEFSTALENYKGEVSTLTGEFETKTGGITSETGYTEPHGKFLSAKEIFEKEEGEAKSAYEKVYGKEDDEEDKGLEGVFTSAKSAYDTLQADYANLASRVKKYERLGLVDPVMKSKKYKKTKAGAGSYL